MIKFISIIKVKCLKANYRTFLQICYKKNQSLLIIKLIHLKVFWNNYSLIIHKEIQYPSPKLEISSNKEIHLRNLRLVLELFRVCKADGFYNM